MRRISTEVVLITLCFAYLCFVFVLHTKFKTNFKLRKGKVTDKSTTLSFETQTATSKTSLAPSLIDNPPLDEKSGRVYLIQIDTYISRTAASN